MNRLSNPTSVSDQIKSKILHTIKVFYYRYYAVYVSVAPSRNIFLTRWKAGGLIPHIFPQKPKFITRLWMIFSRRLITRIKKVYWRCFLWTPELLSQIWNRKLLNFLKSIRDLRTFVNETEVKWVVLIQLSRVKKGRSFWWFPSCFQWSVLLVWFHSGIPGWSW